MIDLADEGLRLAHFYEKRDRRKHMILESLREVNSPLNVAFILKTIYD
jgi:hypothetical protein